MSSSQPYVNFIVKRLPQPFDASTDEHATPLELLFKMLETIETIKTLQKRSENATTVEESRMIDNKVTELGAKVVAMAKRREIKQSESLLARRRRAGAKCVGKEKAAA